MGGWQVVKFSEENVVEVVHSSWLSEEGVTKCYWPDFVSKLKIAAKNKGQVVLKPN